MNLLNKVTDSDLLWALAFVGVCVLVAFGKLKPDVVELMLFSIIGRVGVKKSAEIEDVPSRGQNENPK